MGSKSRTLGLIEFLEEAELQHHYHAIKNVLQVHSVQQLKYVVDDDLFNIGMSRPEARRLKNFYNKVFCLFSTNFSKYFFVFMQVFRRYLVFWQIFRRYFFLSFCNTF